MCVSHSFRITNDDVQEKTTGCCTLNFSKYALLWKQLTIFFGLHLLQRYGVTLAHQGMTMSINHQKIALFSLASYDQHFLIEKTKESRNATPQ